MSGNQAAFSSDSSGPVDGAVVRSWYEDPVAVAHYSRASVDLGLWESERVVFTRVFEPRQTLLDLGCGAGRIALGLWELGYRLLLGVDFSRAMIAEARRLARLLEYGVAFRVGDATRLKLPDRGFEGVVFGFNGLMQIPGRDNRRRALAEIQRVLVPGGRLVFTAHDRDAVRHRAVWEAERRLWESGRRDPSLVEFGDRVYVGDEGRVFIHFPSREEVLEDLDAVGLRHLEDVSRAKIADEVRGVREFSDECRFWLVQREG